GTAHVRSGLDLEPVGRESLHADGRPRPGIAGADVLADPGDQVPPSRHLPSVEHFHLSLVHTAAEAVALGAEPYAIAIAADPATAVEIEAVRTVAPLPLQLIEENEVV